MTTQKAFGLSWVFRSDQDVCTPILDPHQQRTWGTGLVEGLPATGEKNDHGSRKITTKPFR